MNTSESTDMTPIVEGGSEVIQSISRYLDTVGIANQITVAEDCQPGA